MRGKGVKMRILDSKTASKEPMQVFYKIMDNISDILEFYNCQIESDNACNNIYNYVMKNENGLVKIGISNDVDFRKNTLQNASGYLITDIFKIKSKRKALEIESMLHDYFSSYRKIGEWFLIDYNEAVEKTIEFSQLEVDVRNNQKPKKDKNDLLLYLSKICKDDEDFSDYLVISQVLKRNNPDNIKDLIDIYVTKYLTEGGLEAYNLFSLYLLLYLKEHFGIDRFILKNGLVCSMCGHTVYLEDTKINFCECIDWYWAVYEQTKEF